MNLKSIVAIGVFVSTLFSLTAVSNAQIEFARITEMWVGRSGPDATRDWIEITNTGEVAINTANLAYDDAGPSLDTAFVLPALLLQPGESLIFLIDIDADNPVKFETSSIEEFLVIWDPFDFFVETGQADGGLSQNGDSANLLDVSNGQVIDTITYTADIVNDSNGTIERIGDGPTDIRNSVLGENGAYAAQEFEDELCETVLDDNGDPVIIIGSPGVFTMTDTVLIGDVNCDGNVDLLDVAPFVDLITGGGFNEKADINMDGTVDLLDVGPFVVLLTGP